MVRPFAVPMKSQPKSSESQASESRTPASQAWREKPGADASNSLRQLRLLRFWLRRYGRRPVNLILGPGAIALFAVWLSNQELLAQLTWQGWFSLGIALGAFSLSLATQLPTELIFLSSLGLLMLSGVLPTEAALAGFSNTGVVTIGVLYVIVAGLQQSGGLAWISLQVLGRPRGIHSALMRLMLPVTIMSAFLNNIPVVAMFIPIVGDWASKLRLSPSKLMIPLSYSAIFGGVLTLLGTSTNLVVNGMLFTSTGQELGLFDITRVSFPCVVLGIVYLLIAQRWLLPNRKPAISDHDDSRKYTVEMVVAPDSPLADKTIEQAGLRHLPNLFLAEIFREGVLLPAVSPQEKLRANDQLIFVGVVDSVVDLQRIRGLLPATNQVFKLNVPRTERCMIEAVVSNTCPIVGKTIRGGSFRSRYSAVVVAVARNGERLSGKIGDIELRPGDALLLEAPAKFVDQQRLSKDFYLVSGIPNSELLRHERTPLAIAILVFMVLAATLGGLGLLKAAFAAAILMILTGCCATDRLLQSIEWRVLLITAAALGIGKALDDSGAADILATLLLQQAGENPHFALAAVYFATALTTEMITNNAAAALMFPVALSLAQLLGVNVIPFVIVIMLAASASFVTPIGYQTNLMVYGPGGYRFTDFARIGLPLSLIFAAVTVWLTPVMFPF